MTDEERRRVVREESRTTQPILYPVRDPGRDPVMRETVLEERVTRRADGYAIADRIVVLLFGLVQLVIALRIVLLLLDAREGNGLVAAIMAISRPLVGPFEGILRTNALDAGGATFDLAALVALVGWTILELIVLAIVRLPRAESRA